MILIRPSSIVTDAADGADGVMASAITYRRYPDCPRSQPPLAAEDSFNPERAEEALCPARSARECAGTLWPAKPVGADLQKVGCASRPLRSVGHDLAHKGRHWIDVDDVLDRVAPLDRISDFEGARGSKCALAWLTSRSRSQHRMRDRSHLGLRNPAYQFLHVRAGAPLVRLSKLLTMFSFCSNHCSGPDFSRTRFGWPERHYASASPKRGG
jgi:hypothetical protein